MIDLWAKINIRKSTALKLTLLGTLIVLLIWMSDSIGDYIRKQENSLWNNLITINYNDFQLILITSSIISVLMLAFSKLIKNSIEYESLLKKRTKDEAQLVYVITNNLKRAAEANIKYLQKLKDRFGDSLDVRVQESSEKIMEIIEELDYYETIKRKPAKVEHVDVGKLVQKVNNEVIDQLEEIKIKWEWKNPQKIKKIRGDYALLKRAIKNLVINSLKFGEEKLSKITVEIKKTKRYFEFSVSDNGPGIKNIKLVDSFDPFQRVDKSMNVDGMGIGLAIVKEVAIKHQGNIWFRPGENGGVTFYISISRKI